ncbi:hypothetical protein M2387_001298 [Klebsiella sp. BIGb0407]|nr:hypothetical protein [Klebsiella sp. BIGb0407]
MNELLHYNGSLLSSDGLILSSYDLSNNHAQKICYILTHLKYIIPHYIHFPLTIVR